MHQHTHETQNNSTRNIKIAFFLNIAFTIFELIGGLLTNSLAILSDALHDLGDSFSLGLSWYLDKISQKERTKRFSYGYRRFSLLAALINTIVLIIGSIIILSEAVPRILSPEHSDATGMLFFAIAGIVVNGVAVLRLRGGKSMNTQVVAWHLLEDVLGWAAVLVVSIILLFKDIHVLDPILSILITLYVLYNIIKKLKTTLSLFLQAVPESMDLEEIQDSLLNIAGVVSAHHTHVWSLDGEHHVITTHLVVKKDTDKKAVMHIKEQVRKITENMHFYHSTVEIEYEDEDCRMPEEPKILPYG